MQFITMKWISDGGREKSCRNSYNISVACLQLQVFSIFGIFQQREILVLLLKKCFSFFSLMIFVAGLTAFYMFRLYFQSSGINQWIKLFPWVPWNYDTAAYVSCFLLPIDDRIHSRSVNSFTTDGSYFETHIHWELQYLQ